jgi:hypothetical protein
MRWKPISLAILSASILGMLACSVGGSGQPAGNAAPTAVVGPAQAVVTGSLVTLDGSSSSDPNGDPITYAWTLTTSPSGSTATLANPTTSRPAFTADLRGNYAATLVVNDGKLSSAPMTVQIVAAPPNIAPVASAGTPQTVSMNTLVTLDGSGSSDANGDTLTYAWALTTKPSASMAVLNNPTAVKPTFTADIPGTYTATLVVNDGKVSSSPAMVAIVVTPPNTPPVANAGQDQAVATGSVVTLDASASSDADANTMTFAWSLTTVPNGSQAILGSASAKKPTFTADVAGGYVATLVVNDGYVNSAPATVTVTASAPKRLNVPYVAPSGMTITLTQCQAVDAGGYMSYNITYTQANTTAGFIDEGMFILYFADGTSEMQYGFFNSVAPGASLTRSYSWQELKTKVPTSLKFTDFFRTSAVTWLIPIPN